MGILPRSSRWKCSVLTTELWLRCITVCIITHSSPKWLMMCQVKCYFKVWLCVVVYRQQKVAAWRLLSCCLKLMVLLLVSETTVVGHLLTAFQQTLVNRCVHSCLDVLYTADLALLKFVYFYSNFIFVMLMCLAVFFVPNLLIFTTLLSLGILHIR